MSTHIDYQTLVPPAEQTAQRIQDNPDTVRELDDDTLLALLGYSQGYRRKVYEACYDELNRRGDCRVLDATEATTEPVLVENLKPGDVVLIPVWVTSVELNHQAVSGAGIARIGYRTLDALDGDGNLVTNFRAPFLRGLGGERAIPLFRQDPDEFRCHPGNGNESTPFDCTPHRYQVGDQVIVSLADDGRAPGRVTGYDGQFCPTCHCHPVDPDHRGDGSLCCPGPWYQVTFVCREAYGADHEHENNVFAEHELKRRILCDITCGDDCTKCLTVGH